MARKTSGRLRALALCATAVACGAAATPAAAQTAVTPCTDPDGVVLHGRTATQYLMLRYDRPDAGGVKVCVQQAGFSGEPGKLFVIDVPFPGLPSGPPAHDEHGSTCAANGGNVLYSSVTQAGRTRITYIKSSEPPRLWVCLEAPGVSRRVNVPLPDTDVPPPAVGQMPPPWDGALFQPWPAVPSSQCTEDDFRLPSSTTDSMDVVNMWVAGTRTRLSVGTDASGTASVCFRHQDPSGRGVGGRLVADAAQAPTFGTGADTAGCTFLVIDQEEPGEVRVDTSPPVPGAPVSVCVQKGSQVTRATLTPAGGGLVRYEPDPS